MYDIVKDKRYTKDQYEIHIPITINYNANGSHDLNKNVQEMIRQNTDLCTIGLDRGERNLITYCVVNAEGKILEQGSFNKLDAVDYQEKLKQKEQDRQLARKDWKSIENIKELKEGYLSQVVHKLSELMIKYQALVIMEDLNFGFKRGRFGVERQVYQKFEMALLKKLEYLVLSKDEAKATEAGGVLKGYQLAYTPMSLTDVGKQCGCVFYVQPAFTSKIDPTTGFSDIFNYNEYTNSESRKTFFSKMKNIRYDSQKDAFEFTYDYNDYKTYQTFYKTQWTVWTGNPCLVWNNNAKKQECVKVTEELKTLFKKYDIDVTKYNLSEQIRDIPATKDKAEFWSKLLYLFRLAISMRYSVVGSMEDRIISPVRNSDGKQFSTPIFNEIDFDEKHRYDELPMDADANGAYHIALKGQLMFDQIRQVKLNGKGEMPPGTMTVRNADWFKYMQSR